MVGADGTRFFPETTGLKHGHVLFHGLYIRVPVSMPMYVVFDEAARLTKPFYRVWSEGMVDEIEKGWIVKADSLEELAETIGVPAENLVKQVEDYNGYCEAGEDPLGRLPEYLFPFGEGPYYAFPIVPCFINTQGGPVRNTHCQVLNTAREVIPGLFSAGELGSFYSDLYQGAGNIAECIMTGIDAVNTMMEQTADAAPLVFAVAEKPAEVAAEPYEAPVYECGEGQYIGTGDGMSVVTARVTMDGDKIRGGRGARRQRDPAHRFHRYRANPGGYRGGPGNRGRRGGRRHPYEPGHHRGREGRAGTGVGGSKRTASIDVALPGGMILTGERPTFCRYAPVPYSAQSIGALPCSSKKRSAREKGRDPRNAGNSPDARLAESGEGWVDASASVPTVLAARERAPSIIDRLGRPQARNTTGCGSSKHSCTIQLVRVCHPSLACDPAACSRTVSTVLSNSTPRSAHSVRSPLWGVGHPRSAESSLKMLRRLGGIVWPGGTENARPIAWPGPW